MDYLLEKRARAFVLRMVEEILRRVDFDDLPVVHEHHAVGDLACKSHLVGNHEHGDAVGYSSAARVILRARRTRQVFAERRRYLANRRSVLQTALGPQRVQPAHDFQRRALADIAFEAFAVIANMLDYAIRPIVG